MTGLAHFHAAFGAMLIGGDVSALAPHLEGDASGLRVYRNNAARSVADSLGSAYPAVRRLAGARWFDAAAIAYMRARPPRSRSLVAYGEGFPDFVERLDPDAPPWLAAVARLDRAWLEAHLAEDVSPLTAADFDDAGALAQTRCALHPSARLIDNEWAVHALWAASRVGGQDAQTPRAREHGAETSLIWRRQNEAADRTLNAGEAAFVRAVAAGQSLGAASAQAQAAGGAVAQIFAATLEAGVLARNGEEKT